MTGVVPPLVVTVLLGSLLTLDRMAFGQFSFSRPLFAATLAGYFLQCPAEGAFVGMVYELLFLRSIPAGSFVPYHPLHGSLVAVLIFASGCAGPTGWSALPMAILLSMPALLVDRVFEILWRRSNGRALLEATALVRRGNVKFARLVHLRSVLRASLFSAAALFTSGLVLSGLCGFISSRLPGLATTLSVAGLAPFFIGLAGMVSGRKFKLGRTGFLSGLLFGAILGSGYLF